MDAAESEQRYEPLDTAGVRRVGCKHKCTPDMGMN